MEQKKKNAFTLVELLAVIVILGLLAAVAVPSIIGPLKNSKQDLYEFQIKNIKEAAKSWAAENVFSLPSEGETKIIYLKNLGSFIDTEIKNPLTNELFGQCLEVAVEKISGQDRYTYEVQEDTINNDTGC